MLARNQWWWVVSLICATFCLCAHAEQEESIEYTRYIKYPTVDYGQGERAALIKKGEYLVKASDCAACHTSVEPGSQPFAGGLGIKTPFGTFYSPNITPDEEHGIGKWTDQQFIKAMQTGVAPGWRHLFPVFPYLYYAKIRRDDLVAIKAYLNAIPAVPVASKSHDVPFPLNVRILQIGWRMLFFYLQNQGEYKDDPSQSAEWNRGAYLVQGPGHCGMCHTPFYQLGAPKRKYFLRGKFIDNYYAPDITSEGLKDASIEQIMDVFAEGKHLSGQGVIHGPMAEVDHNSLRFLTPEDAKAIAVYLKTVKSAKPKATHPHTTGDGAAKALYEDKCAVCHNTGAALAPKLGDSQAWEPRIASGKPALYHNAIQGVGSMPAKGTCSTCTDAEIEAVVDYMVAKAQAADASEHERRATPAAPTSAQRGQQIYQDHCSTCHSQSSSQAPQLGDKAFWQPQLDAGFDKLIIRTLARDAQHKNMCTQCSDGDLISALKYIAEQSKQSGDYRLW